MKIIKKIKQRFCNHIGKYACYRKGNRYICNCEKCGKTLIDFTIIREKIMEVINNVLYQWN